MPRRATNNPDQVRFQRRDHIGGIEVVTARYERRSFPPHAHEEYVLGVMTAGSEILSIRGSEHLIDSRRLILIGPGEVHSNRGATDDPFAYAVMYVPAPVVTQALSEFSGRDSHSLPRFQEAAPAARDLRSVVLRTHAVLEADNGPLEQESALLMFLSDLFRMGEVRWTEHSIVDRRSVQRAREYLEAQFRDKFSLGHLASVAGLSRFHLVRSFKDHIGLTPAAYNIQLRIAEAKRLIRSGCPLAHAATDVGFSDQSHLTRHFQRIVGMTPGRYAQQ